MKVGEFGGFRWLLSMKNNFCQLAGECLFEKNFKMITLVGLVCQNFLVN